MLLGRCVSGLTLSRYVTSSVCVADLRYVFDVRDIYNNQGRTARTCWYDLNMGRGGNNNINNINNNINSR